MPGGGFQSWIQVDHFQDLDKIFSDVWCGKLKCEATGVSLSMIVSLRCSLNLSSQFSECFINILFVKRCAVCAFVGYRFEIIHGVGKPFIQFIAHIEDHIEWGFGIEVQISFEHSGYRVRFWDEGLIVTTIQDSDSRFWGTMNNSMLGMLTQNLIYTSCVVRRSVPFSVIRGDCEILVAYV
jgi:hypothetical protein